MSILERISHFIMREFISSVGTYNKHGHMSGFADLCDWKNEGHSKLCQIHEQFKYLMNFCYCDIIIYLCQCLMKCVPKSDMD
jgi:hypothetical protein